MHFDAELVELLAEEAAAEDDVTVARLAALQTCVEKLSDRQQEILRRCYAESTTITEVAQTLGRERGAPYKQLARLKESLLECIRLRLTAAGA